MHFSLILRPLLAVMIMVAAQFAHAQQWTYMVPTIGPHLSGQVHLLPGANGEYKLRYFNGAPWTSSQFCVQLADVNVEYAPGILTITPKQFPQGCEKYRLLIRTDGSGGSRELLDMEGQWRREAVNRGLTALQPAAAWFVAKFPAQAVVGLVAPVTAAAPTSDREKQKLEDELRELRSQMSARQTTAGVVTGPRFTVRALVIGNSAYSSFGRLANPRNDAQAIAEKFRTMRIQVDLVLDADRDTFVKALNDFSARASSHDVSILYYAGHGVQVEGNNYLVPTNMKADGISAGYIKLSGISLNAALDYMPGTTRIVFLDACRDNPASRSLVTTRSTGAAGLAPVSVASGTLIAYATKDGATAEDGQGSHSPYTTALLEHLDRPEDIAVVLRRVRQTVMRLTANRQEPWEYGSLVGDQLVLSQAAK